MKAFKNNLHKTSGCNFKMKSSGTKWIIYCTLKHNFLKATIPENIHHTNPQIYIKHFQKAEIFVSCKYEMKIESVFEVYTLSSGSERRLGSLAHEAGLFFECYQALIILRCKQLFSFLFSSSLSKGDWTEIIITL